MSTRRLVVLGLVVSALVAGVLSFYASSRPDGLTFVAESLGFSGTARDSATAGSPLAGYAVSGVGDARLVRRPGGVGRPRGDRGGHGRARPPPAAPLAAA